MTADDSVSLVIERIYAAVGEPALWQPCLESVCRLLASDSANLFYVDQMCHKADVIAAGRVRLLDQRTAAQPPLTLQDWSSESAILPSVTPIPRERMAPVPESAIPNTIRHEQETALVVSIDTELPSAQALIAVERVRDASSFCNADASVLATLVPHLRRALILHRRIIGLTADKGTLADIIDDLRAGVILAGMDGTVISANRAAARTLRSRDGLLLHRSRLRTGDAASTATLQRAIEAVSRSYSMADPGSRRFVSAPKPSGTGSLHIMVTPILRDRATPAGATAVLWISDPDTVFPVTAPVLEAAFGLNPTECRVAIALADGRSVAEIAETLRMTKDTCRWYVKQILHKTGTTSQARAVRAILSAVT